MKQQLPLAFVNWFLALLEAFALEHDLDELEPEESTTLAPRIFGQIGTGGLTGRQSNLTSRPDQVHQTAMVGGVRVALGDTKKQYTRPIPPPRNSPVVAIPTPHQPVISLAVGQRKVGDLPSWFATQIGVQRYRYDEATQQFGVFTDYDSPEAQYPLEFALRDQLTMDLDGPIPYEKIGYLSNVYPGNMPYSAGVDNLGRSYIASWPRWDKWQSQASVNGPPSSGSIAITLGAGQYVSGDIYVGGGSAEPVMFTGPSAFTALKFMPTTVEQLRDANNQRIEVPYTETFWRMPGTQNTLSAVRESFFSLSGGEQLSRALHAIEGLGGNFVFREFITLTLQGAFIESEVGNYTRMVDVGFLVSLSVQSGIGLAATETEPEANIPGSGFSAGFSGRHMPSGAHFIPAFEGYQFPEPPLAVPQIPFSSPGTGSVWETATFENPPDFDTLISSNHRNVRTIVKKLTDAEKRAIIPFYDGYPNPPTAASRADASLLNPYIYDRPDVFGRLANPVGVLGVGSTWCGLAWSTLNYVCDCFYALDAERTEHLYGVAIIKDGSYKAFVGMDEVQVYEGALLDFFPGSEGSVSFLDGSAWDGALRPNYHFAHPQHPFRDVAYLAPFRARLRGRQDKSGPQDCPLVIYLESDDDAL